MTWQYIGTWTRAATSKQEALRRLHAHLSEQVGAYTITGCDVSNPIGGLGKPGPLTYTFTWEAEGE